MLTDTKCRLNGTWLLRKAVLRIRDVYPGSWFLPIPDLGFRIQKQQQMREVEKKLDVKPLFVATKFNKIVNYFSLEVLKKKFGPIFKEL